jgi:hypothetical protein
MPLEVVTAALDNALTTVNTVKRDVVIAGSTDDAFIRDLILRASAAIERYTGRKFGLEEVIEKLPGTGRPTLLLSRIPIVLIDSITFDGTEIDDDDWEIQDVDAGILFNRVGWQSTQLIAHNIEPIDTGYASFDWVVAYSGGFVLPGWPDIEDSDFDAPDITLPYDIQQACVEMVKNNFQFRDSNTSIQREKVGEADVTYINGLALPKPVQQTLDLYRLTEL